MDAWAVVMNDQAIKQATHACAIELSSGTLDRVVTVLSMIITSAFPSHRISLVRLLQEIPIWGVAVVLYGICGHGRRKGQSPDKSPDQRLSIPRARGHGVGVLKCGVLGHPEHKALSRIQINRTRSEE